MSVLYLQVNKPTDLLVILKFGLMSDDNITSINRINHLLQEGAMNHASAYKPDKPVVPKVITTNSTATTKADTGSTSSPAPSTKRPASPAQLGAQRNVKGKSNGNVPKSSSRSRQSRAGRQPVPGGGNITRLHLAAHLDCVG